jgi:hypothetical protein
MLSKKLNSALSDFVPAAGAQGTSRTVDRDKLRSRLDQIRRDSTRTYKAAAVMTAAIFVLIVAFIILYRERWEIVTGLLSVLGVTVATSITRMTRLARDIADTGLLIQLSGGLTGEQAFKVIETLLATGRR